MFTVISHSSLGNNMAHNAATRDPGPGCALNHSEHYSHPSGCPALFPLPAEHPECGEHTIPANQWPNSLAFQENGTWVSTVNLPTITATTLSTMDSTISTECRFPWWETASAGNCQRSVQVWSGNSTSASKSWPWLPSRSPLGNSPTWRQAHGLRSSGQPWLPSYSLRPRISWETWLFTQTAFWWETTPSLSNPCAFQGRHLLFSKRSHPSSKGERPRKG